MFCEHKSTSFLAAKGLPAAPGGLFIGESPKGEWFQTKKVDIPWTSAFANW